MDGKKKKTSPLSPNWLPNADKRLHDQSCSFQAHKFIDKLLLAVHYGNFLFYRLLSCHVGVSPRQSDPDLSFSSFVFAQFKYLFICFHRQSQHVAGERRGRD